MAYHSTYLLSTHSRLLCFAELSSECALWKYFVLFLIIETVPCISLVLPSLVRLLCCVVPSYVFSMLISFSELYSLVQEAKRFLMNFKWIDCIKVSMIEFSFEYFVVKRQWHGRAQLGIQWFRSFSLSHCGHWTFTPILLYTIIYFFSHYSPIIFFLKICRYSFHPLVWNLESINLSITGCRL